MVLVHSATTVLESSPSLDSAGTGNTLIMAAMECSKRVNVAMSTCEYRLVCPRSEATLGNVRKSINYAEPHFDKLEQVVAELKSFVMMKKGETCFGG